MRPMFLAPVFAAMLLGSGCGQPTDPTASASTEASMPRPEAAGPELNASPAPSTLPEKLDCLRQSGGVLVIGHRGGPTRDYPENAIETFERTLRAGTPGMEIDIAETKDGVLVLMHDEELDRTTTGEGLVADHTWEDIQKLKLETYSQETAFHPPTLEQALTWAVRNDVLVELDKKRSASFGPIIAAVRAAHAENNVFIITYTDEQAIEIHTEAPDLVITATVDSTAHLDDLLSKGVKADRLVAWTGTQSPDPDLWKALAARGVESAFGTLGPRASSLDGRYWEDDDGSEYTELVAGGLPILVTDITDKVSRQLSEFRPKSVACGF